MKELTTDQKEIVRLAHADSKKSQVDKELLFLQKLQEINASLKILTGKEYPEFPAMPEMQKMDMSETNALLKTLIEKEKDIEVSLHIV